MLDHIILTVSDFERSVDFYNKAMEPLGISMVMDYKGPDNHPDLKGFGNGNNIIFWMKEGKANSNGTHIGFVAKAHAQVDAFHKVAVAAGAKVLESPRVFPEYYPGYYATWVLDPDGYEIELVHKS